jgi:hypothetical protein
MANNFVRLEERLDNPLKTNRFHACLCGKPHAS